MIIETDNFNVFEDKDKLNDILYDIKERLKQ